VFAKQRFSEEYNGVSRAKKGRPVQTHLENFLKKNMN
jgi:hypothetical protein